MTIVSRTDLKGKITYINDDFLEASGFAEAELIGQPHNIVRHPDMPEEAFADMWATLKAGRPWLRLSELIGGRWYDADIGRRYGSTGVSRWMSPPLTCVDALGDSSAGGSDWPRSRPCATL